jgi:hypothetical protein
MSSYARLCTWVVLALAALVATACPTVDQGEPPVAPESCLPDFQTFKNVVWPTAIANADPEKSCVAKSGCHARESGRSALRLIPEPGPDAEHQMNYDTVTRFLNCSTPEASPFITKPSSGGDPHAGGDLWDLGEEPELTVERWIAGTP